MKYEIWNMEYGIYGIWNMKYEIWNIEYGICALNISTTYIIVLNYAL